MSKLKHIFAGYTINRSGEITNRFGRKIKAQTAHNGYMRVELWQNSKGKKYLLHRLLADAFIPNPHDKPCVNHIDGDKANNCLSNLEWVTRSENQLHAYSTGLQKGYKKPTSLTPEHKMALCGSRWRGQKRIYHANDEQFNSPEEAASRFQVNRQTFYNRANSEKFPKWKIEVRQEEK